VYFCRCSCIFCSFSYLNCYSYNCNFFYSRLSSCIYSSKVVIVIVIVIFVVVIIVIVIIVFVAKFIDLCSQFVYLVNCNGNLIVLLSTSSGLL